TVTASSTVPADASSIGGGGIPGAIVVGGGSSTAGGGSHGGNSNDQLISKRTGRTQSPPAMFLPPGMRHVGGSSGGTSPVVRKVSGDASPVAGGTAQNLISEIEPAPASLSNPQFQIPIPKAGVAPSASGIAAAANAASVVTAAAAAAAAAISGGGVDSRTNVTRPERTSMEVLPTSTAATALAATVADGSVRGSGPLPSPGVGTAAAAPVVPSRTTEGTLLHSEEDYGMWLAQRQKMSQPGSEASFVQLQHQPRSQLQPQPQPSSLGVAP
ncbi:hypothetical protein Vretifemale_13416, partial [Volvox reticuliferus]